MYTKIYREKESRSLYTARRCGFVGQLPAGQNHGLPFERRKTLVERTRLAAIYRTLQPSIAPRVSLASPRTAKFVSLLLVDVESALVLKEARFVVSRQRGIGEVHILHSKFDREAVGPLSRLSVENAIQGRKKTTGSRSLTSKLS